MQHEQQRPYYHVTDKAALMGCTAKAAYEIFRALRHGDLHRDWRITTLAALPGHDANAGEGLAAQVKVHG